MTRQCSRTGCGSPAVATLTYVYRDSTAVLGPLATYAEPHTYDLCDVHAERLTAPRGWDVVRLSGDYTPPPPSTDDLLALADAVREAGRPRRSATGGTSGTGAGPAATAAAAGGSAEDRSGAVEVHRRGHLRVLRDAP
ncbi:uncharacterized protein DUF3499 [Lapillicoccus jejuensis]|uniref:Uncharacterized protein DUF3499 n=1 Tax=Lapillicoccus jejuensis TaxID=402171 RepID=A0A542E2G5_9MICO|nr:uncharacterized protein DUF3499 [Lapillicoccus jejuensis]